MPTATDRSVAAPGRARAWSWVAHLRGGGTTPWSAWTGTQGRDAPEADADPVLPGAQQLELLRRLNLAGRPDPGLAERVLSAAAVGRGRHDLELAGADEPGRFGPAPVDPADLSVDELLRVATGLIARALADSSAVPRDPRARLPQTNRRTRRIRRRYRLAGDPALAEPLRAALTADGRPPGGQGAAVHVLGTDVATMLGHAWVTGAFAEGGVSWPDYLAQWRQRGGVPRRIDLPAIADRWRADPGVGRVDVVLDPSRLPHPPPVSAAAADLARRTSPVLGLLVAADERDRLLATGLRPHLERAPGPPPTVPPEHRDWVDERAARMRRRILASEHPVVGDVDRLLPHWTNTGPQQAADPSPLDLAVTLILGGLA